MCPLCNKELFHITSLQMLHPLWIPGSGSSRGGNQLDINIGDFCVWSVKVSDVASSVIYKIVSEHLQLKKKERHSWNCDPVLFRNRRLGFFVRLCFSLSSYSKCSISECSLPPNLLKLRTPSLDQLNTTLHTQGLIYALKNVTICKKTDWLSKFFWRLGISTAQMLHNKMLCIS